MNTTAAGPSGTGQDPPAPQLWRQVGRVVFAGLAGLGAATGDAWFVGMRGWSDEDEAGFPGTGEGR